MHDRVREIALRSRVVSVLIFSFFARVEAFSTLNTSISLMTP